MEINEEIKILTDFMSEKSLCKGKEEPEKLGWECRIGDKGSPGDLDTPTAARLYANMKQAGVNLPEDPPRKEGAWDLDQCTPSRFPLQSHHMIPKKHLPKKDVCVWLAKNAANGQWKLTESTNYDTDDARNGIPLPFASTTLQWKSTSDVVEQTKICNLMMFKTGKQLHQGSHTYEDYGEEDNLHAKEKPGYLGAVDELLKVVNGQTLNHVTLCPDCKKSNAKPVQIRPLERIVASIHQVSHLMESIITKRKRFVSKRAAEYVKP